MSQPSTEQRPMRFYGAAIEMLYSKEREVLLSGPAGTGKSRAMLEKLHMCAEKYPGMRGLILRKTRHSLTESALVTFEDKVVPAQHPILRGLLRRTRQSYDYPNGSEIIVAGLDNPDRVMSTEYDLAYIQEATECEEDWLQKLSTRMRNGVMPYQQILMDCNPHSPAHWLYQRSQRGQTRMLESRHDDNPSVTPEYIATLDALTGVLLKRLRYGLWVAAEGAVYDSWDPAIHRVYRFDVPPEWPRYWSVDFGFTNPFVWQEWAEDADGRLYRIREIYRTARLVEDHAREILAITQGSPTPRAIVCDHDAEDRATLERHLGLNTVAAYKGVSPGIQAVATRLKVQKDGKPRLFFLRDGLVERDPLLQEKRLPASTEEEFDGYIWDTSNNRKKGEEPVKKNDHGLDATRYLVAFVDSIGSTYSAPVAMRGAPRKR